MDEHDALILCGGLGTRLQGVVRDVPKVMADVDGRPFLDHILEHVKGQGIARVILCTGYKAAKIEDYYREHDQGLTIDFSREEEPLGTGGAVKNAREIITSDPFFVLNGDSFVTADFKGLLGFHGTKGALASVLIARVERADDFGSIRIDDDDRITGFSEKAVQGEPSYVNAGVYCFSRAIFDCMPEDVRFSLETDLFPMIAGEGLYGCKTDKDFLDIGTPQRYASAKGALKKGDNCGH